MIAVKIWGLDYFSSTELAKDLTTRLASLMEVKENEIEFIICESSLIHGKTLQEGYIIRIEISAPKNLDTVVIKDQIVSLLKAVTKAYTIHLMVLFSFFDKKDSYDIFEEGYSPYLEKLNDDSDSSDNEDEDDSDEDDEDDDDDDDDDDEDEDEDEDEECDCDDDKECDCSEEKCHCSDSHHHSKNHVCHCHDDDKLEEEEIVGTAKIEVEEGTPYLGNVFEEFDRIISEEEKKKR